LTFSDLRFSITLTNQKKEKEQREILSGCSGVLQPGRLCAVLGASGAGKTSLLNLLSGNPTAGDRGGSIQLNGQEVFDRMGRVREMSAYIQQDDILMATEVSTQ
jgi:ABC-type multidrug transport system ATPase subunit